MAELRKRGGEDARGSPPARFSNGNEAVPFTVTKAMPNPSAYEQFVGGIGASCFALVYIVAPIWLLSAVWLLCTAPFAVNTWIIISPIVLSAVLPPVASKQFLQQWPFKYMPAYFDYEEVREMDDEQIQHLMATKRVLMCAQPHGVFSFGGACAGVEWSKKWWDPNMSPTAAASSVMLTPIVKHVVGLFGVCDASSKGLSKTLAKKSAVLYCGGIAELFLSSTEEERLFILKRKGFIKLALRTGRIALNRAGICMMSEQPILMPSGCAMTMPTNPSPPFAHCLRRGGRAPVLLRQHLRAVRVQKRHAQTSGAQDWRVPHVLLGAVRPADPARHEGGGRPGAADGAAADRRADAGGHRQVPLAVRDV
jgi:hypothetical protein